MSSKSLDEDLAAASARHDALLHAKAEHAHEQVEHVRRSFSRIDLVSS
jgi:hypothetical protein